MREITAVIDKYKQAVYAKDVEAFAALYDERVRVFDLWGTWVYEGRSAWRDVATFWFDSLGSERVAVTTEDVRIESEGALATASGFITYTGESASGEKLRSMRNRFTWTLGLTDGVWRITHEHTSAPADFDSRKLL